MTRQGQAPDVGHVAHSRECGGVDKKIALKRDLLPSYQTLFKGFVSQGLRRYGAQYAFGAQVVLDEASQSE